MNEGRLEAGRGDGGTGVIAKKRAAASFPKEAAARSITTLKGSLSDPCSVAKEKYAKARQE
jgi:hypothetical protein